MAKTSWFVLVVAAVAGVATPAAAQGKSHGKLQAAAEGKGHGKHYVVSSTRAVTVTRTVLERQGYNIVRIERVGPTQVIYYRRGNNGRGRGLGPLQKMVVRTVRNEVVFEEAPPAILVDIDIKLR